LNIKNELQTVLGNYAIAIEHVGSTSVEGLAAKPIIDIDIVISDYSVLEEVVRRLSKIGYEHEGNLGIEGREAFRYEGKCKRQVLSGKKWKLFSSSFWQIKSSTFWYSTRGIIRGIFY